MNQHSPTDPHADDLSERLADQLDDLIPPGRGDLPAHDLLDPALVVARQLAASEHPHMAADRVDQLEAQLRARAAIQQPRRSQRRRIVRVARWAAAAIVVIVFAVTLTIGIALLDEDDPHLVAPDDTAYDAPDDTAQQPVTVRESRESSLFIIPPGP